MSHRSQAPLKDGSVCVVSGFSFDLQLFILTEIYSLSHLKELALSYWRKKHTKTNNQTNNHHQQQINSLWGTVV